MGRFPGGNEPEAGQMQGLADFFGRPQVPVMDRVKGAAEEPQALGSAYQKFLPFPSPRERRALE